LPIGLLLTWLLPNAPSWAVLLVGLAAEVWLRPCPISGAASMVTAAICHAIALVVSALHLVLLLALFGGGGRGGALLCAMVPLPSFPARPVDWRQ
jgi:hypothetical protein